MSSNASSTPSRCPVVINRRINVAQVPNAGAFVQVTFLVFGMRLSAYRPVSRQPSAVRCQLSATEVALGKNGKPVTSFECCQARSPRDYPNPNKINGCRKIKVTNVDKLVLIVLYVRGIYYYILRMYSFTTEVQHDRVSTHPRESGDHGRII